MWGRFTEHDTTEENLRTLEGWLRRYGRPLAHYTDKASIFRAAGPQPLSEQLRGDPLRTQFGRALHELGIEWIAAHSPQAKGRIERLFETLQDRLVKEMRLAGIDSIAAANHFLETRFVPEWEQRFTAVARNPRNVHRPLGRGTAPGGNFECARGPQSSARPHRQLGWKSLGSSAGRSLCRAAGSGGRDRTAVRRKPLAALPGPLSTLAFLPRTGAAARKSFRPTASRTCGTNTADPKTKSKPKYHVPAEPSLEKTVEADISTWQKTRTFLLCVDTNTDCWRAA